MPIFNPTNYSLVTPVSDDTVLVRQASTGRIKSALVSALANAASPIQLAATVADLKAIPTSGLSDGALAILAGYYESGDGGSGQFYYSVTSTEGDNGGTVLAPDDNVGRWLRQTEGDILPAKAFGVVGDGISNDTVPMQLALNAASDQGGSVSIAGLRVRCTGLNVPDGVGIIGGIISYPDPRDALLLETFADTLLLQGSSATVTLNETSSIQGLKILPYGMEFPQDAADVATWVGTAVTINDGGHSALLSRLAIVGFARAVNMDNASFTEQTRMSQCAIDCVAGVRLVSGTDRIYISEVECWPTASIGLGSPTDADLQRSGIAFELNAVFGIDAPFLLSCFSYGYATGFRLNSVNGAVLMNCVADYTSTKTATIYGFDIAGDSSVTTLIGCKIFRSTSGLRFIPNQSVHSLLVSSSSFEFCDTNGALLGAGNGSILGCFFSNLTVSTTNGINANNCAGTCRFFVDNNVFNYMTNAVAVTGTSPGDVIVWGKNVVTGNGTNLIIGTGINTYPSAATLAIPAAEDTFFVSGVVGITAIATAVAYQGRKITLIFQGVLTMTHSASLRLAGATNWTTVANDNITLVYDGSAWREVARCEA